MSSLSLCFWWTGRPINGSEFFLKSNEMPLLATPSARPKHITEYIQSASKKFKTRNSNPHSKRFKIHSRIIQKICPLTQNLNVKRVQNKKAHAVRCQKL